MSRQQDESAALRAQQDIDRELEMDIKQLEFKKRLAAERKEAIRRDLLMKQKAREVGETGEICYSFW